MFFSYDDHGIQRQLEHRLPSQLVGDPQERTYFRNMSRQERYKAIGTMMQPLLRPLGDHRGNRGANHWHMYWLKVQARAWL